jgi:3-hydroxyisobutyrate dehydrogenase-like beta-hydroxyacid dehydrogenase
LLSKDVDTCMEMLQEKSVAAPSLKITREVIQVAKNILGEESDHLEIVKIIEEWSGEKIE